MSGAGPTANDLQIVALAATILSYARNGRPPQLDDTPVYTQVRAELIRAGRIRRDTIPAWRTPIDTEG